ncbi:nuclear transport factor 2 family protein [Akkermansiaceae bacterium]|nr:nuclear transport factor 2 family protein [Akkermansiaceae bacterium]
MSYKIVLQTLPLILLALLAVLILIPACAPYPDTAARTKEYKSVLAATGAESSATGSLAPFTTFLQNISDKDYVRENTAKVYAEDAYLNDTLVTHHGPEEIMAYFHNTADTMTSYQVTIDDIASNGAEHYVRWTMVFSAPKLNGGKPVESVGVSHVRLNAEGKVTMHQDFWDSGMNIYGQIPVLGGVIETIRRRFEK